MNYTGKIIVLAYPDTFVTVSDEWICKLLPLVGLGTWSFIKAGHAALILVENKTGDARYYDFGRYVTPRGYGRTRSADTDVELTIDFSAQISANNELTNLNEFLLWLDTNSQKTHGDGRLLASVCDVIDFRKAREYVTDLQQRGSILYGAFDKSASNCARFVTETILTATSDKKIINGLNFNKIFTPSAVGNVEKAAALGSVYEVFNGEIKIFKGSAFRENLINYFDKTKPRVSHNSMTNGKSYSALIPIKAQKLSGTGSSAWFELTTEEDLPKYHFRIKRYNDLRKIDFDGVFFSSEFDTTQPFEFTYDSHCVYCHVLQKNEKIKLECVASYAKFNSSRKVRSA